MKPPEDQSHAELLGIDMEALKQERFSSGRHTLMLYEYQRRRDEWQRESEALRNWLDFRADLD